MRIDPEDIGGRSLLHPLPRASDPEANAIASTIPSGSGVVEDVSAPLALSRRSGTTGTPVFFEPVLGDIWVGV